MNIFTILGVIGLLLFILPVPAIGFELGNATGVIVFALILLFGVFQKEAVRTAQHFWQYTYGKIVLCLCGAIAAAICGLVIVESVCMIRAAAKTPDNSATVIVLGCQVKDGKPGKMLTTRLERACAYLEENPDSVCILCGGQGEDESISEAEAMYVWLVNKGVDRERLIMEDRSASTHENLVNAQTIIQEQKLSTSVAIVTDGFHEYRALREAQQVGLNAGAVPALTTPIYFPTFYVRELYGILYIWLKG